MANGSTLLEVKNLVKQFKNVNAVQGVNFKITEGTCFGLLGPNGAGKSTTIEMLESISTPTSGQILFKGKPLDRSFKEYAGIQFQATSLPDFLTVREVLRLFSSLYDRPAKIEDLISLCQLEEFLDRDSHKLSGGQKQRLLLALALVNQPEIIFLDEPTTGLDPGARRNFWDLIQKIKAQKKTIVLTTHYMEEAFWLCDTIVLMDHGKIIAEGPPRDLLKQHFDTTTLVFPTEDAPFLKPLSGTTEWGDVVHLEPKTELMTRDVNVTLKKLIEAGADLKRLEVRAATLEDLFIKLVK